MSFTDEIYALFERDGETVVRDNLAAGIYLPNNDALAREWLQRKDRERNDAFQASQADTAQRAATAAELASSEAKRAADAAERQAEAAERAAIAADRANTRATIALAIAAISAVTAIVSIIVSMIMK